MKDYDPERSDYDSWTAKVRPWNLHVSEILRPWKVGVRPVYGKSATLESACQWELTRPKITSHCVVWAAARQSEHTLHFLLNVALVTHPQYFPICIQPAFPGWTPQHQDGRPIVRDSKLLQPLLHFLDKICTPRLLWASLCNLALKLRNICRDSLILLIGFQCFKIAFATAEPNCCVISVLQPPVSTQLSSSYQIIKPFGLDSEIGLHRPICFHEQRAKLVGLDIKMGPITCCSVCSTTAAGLAIATARIASVSCTSLAAHGYGLCPHLHFAATPPWLRKTERHGKHRQIAGYANPKSAAIQREDLQVRQCSKWKEKRFQSVWKVLAQHLNFLPLPHALPLRPRRLPRWTWCSASFFALARLSVAARGWAAFRRLAPDRLRGKKLPTKSPQWYQSTFARPFWRELLLECKCLNEQHDSLSKSNRKDSTKCRMQSPQNHNGQSFFWCNCRTSSGHRRSFQLLGYWKSEPASNYAKFLESFKTGKRNQEPSKPNKEHQTTTTPGSHEKNTMVSQVICSAQKWKMVWTFCQPQKIW